jgi:hypothetical protein
VAVIAADRLARRFGSRLVVDEPTFDVARDDLDKRRLTE